MANFIKENSYTMEQLEVSQVAKAISHPARLAIIEILLNNKSTCNDLVKQLPLAQSTVSQHLKELKKVNIVSSLEQPPKTIYTIDEKKYGKVKQLLNQFFNKS